STMYQYSFPCFGLTHLEHVRPYSKESFRNGRCLYKTYAFRNIQGLAFRYDAIFSITATIGQTTDLITNFKFSDIATHSFNNTGNFQTRNWRYPFRHRI